jgi:hypothetical protein
MSPTASSHVNRSAARDGSVDSCAIRSTAIEASIVAARVHAAFAASQVVSPRILALMCTKCQTRGVG